MKYLIILSTFILFPFVVSCQDDFEFSENTANVYVEVISSSALSSKTEEVILNFGSSSALKKLEIETLKGTVFNTSVEALAYLEKKGWLYRSSNTFSADGKMIRYILFTKYVDLTKYK